MAYRVCVECDITHYENCGTCFGFGILKPISEGAEICPVSAGDAHRQKPRREALPCPECKSGMNGVNNGPSR